MTESETVSPEVAPAKPGKVKKPAKAKKEAKPKAGPKSKLRAGGKPAEEVLEIAAIERSVCAAVRAKIDPETVERYKEADESLPPIEVYRGKEVDYAADGGHRIEAKLASGGKTIRAIVHKCKDDADAYREALLHAMGPANVRHGLPRSSADLRATVRTALLTTDIGVQSDRAVSQICHCNRSVVKRVRIELRDAGKLTGKAAVRYADEDKPTTTAGEVIHSVMPKGVEHGDDDESTITANGSKPPLGKVEFGPESTGRAATEDTIAGVQNDEKGRPVPFNLAAVFQSRSQFRSIQSRVSGLMSEISTLAQSAAGDAIQLNLLKQDVANLTSGLAGFMPYCVCPSCEGSGYQSANNACPTCRGVDSSTRGWIPRLRWQQMTAALQAVTEGPW